MLKLNVTTACIHVLNNGRSQDCYLLQCAREIWYHSAVNDFLIQAEHIAAASNWAADSLSRWHLGMRYQERFTSQRASVNFEEDVDPRMFLLATIF